jgi:DNA-binding NarL/FixJ family response regulator
MVTEALRARPDGFVEKSESLATLREAIAAVINGRSYFSAIPAEMLSLSLGGEDTAVSSREREVAQMIAEGGSSKTIADRLGIARKTVENHRLRIMKKLRVHCAADLARYAVARGWVSAEANSGQRRNVYDL